VIVGVISDTHGLLRPEALDLLRGSEHILHAGDIGAPEIVPELKKIAPVTAIRGNVDVQHWVQSYPATAVVELGGATFYLIHDVNALDLDPKAAGFTAVISGHSHQHRQETRNGVLYFNPGSAGPRRFNLPITVGRLYVTDGVIECRVLDVKLSSKQR
jgi:uncharacterized protein